MFSDMLEAEKKLFDACQKGEYLILGDDVPKEKTAENEIRGEFLRALILNNNQEINENGRKYILRIDPAGVQFRGAYISGRFTFAYCSTDLPFIFITSNFEEEISLYDSKIKVLSLEGSAIVSLNASGVDCKSDIFLRNGFKATGEVNFQAARIGNLSCSNGEFNNENGYALICENVKIEGAVFLDKNFKATGRINFDSCYIGKSLILLTVDKISYLNVTSAYIKELIFDFEKVEKIDLDGLVYEHIYLKDFDLPLLHKWLETMSEFRPQPYKQLAKVLKEMGHHRDADDIMVRYHQKLNSQATWKDFNNIISKLIKPIYGVTAGYGYKPMRVIATMLIVWLTCSLLFWDAAKVGVFAPSNPLVFQKKDTYNCHVDTNGTAWSDACHWQKYDGTNNWTLNEKLDGEYTTFNPFWYSLDVILPIVDLQVEKDWGQYVSANDWTFNDFTRWFMWFEILIGWIYSLILVAILSGLAKNEKD